MTIALLVAFILTLIVLAAMAAVHAHERHTRRDLFKRRVVIVPNNDQPSYDGVLLREFRDCVVLTGVTLIEEQMQPQTVAGEVVVPRSQIAFIQLVKG